jgi:hypothetical protein
MSEAFCSLYQYLHPITEVVKSLNQGFHLMNESLPGMSEDLQSFLISLHSPDGQIHALCLRLHHVSEGAR